MKKANIMHVLFANCGGNMLELVCTSKLQSILSGLITKVITSLFDPTHR